MDKQNSEQNKKLCMRCMEFYSSEFDLCPYCGYEEGQGSRELLHMEPGSELHKRYIVGESIGYGGFGITYIGWDTLLKRKVAIKEYMPSEFSTRMLHQQELTIANNEKKNKQFHDGMKKFIREAEKLAQVGSIDGIVHVFDSFEENNTAYIVMEYLEGETLTAYLQQEGMIDEHQALDLMIPILQALEIVHEKGIIHRDIAPDNIFLVKDKDGNRNVKLIDFGASKYATTSHSKSLTVIIKPGYSPEEQYRSDGDQGTYTDVYAMAAVMYKMVTGQTPPDAFERRTSIESKKKDILQEPSKYVKDLSDNFETALLNAMNVRIEDRTATVSDFIDELISVEPVKRRGTSIRKIDFMKWPLWAKIVVPVSAVASVALVVLLAVGIIQYVAEDIVYELPEGMTLVPDLINENLTDAKDWIADAELVLTNSGGEYSPNIPENLVLSQNIAAGCIVNKNSVISVQVSTGEDIYLLPDVIGFTEEEARAALECMGLEVLCREESQPGLDGGCVVSQDIAPYTEVKTGETITLGITPAGSSVGGEAPDFTGLTYEEAMEKADAAGFRLIVADKIFSKKQDHIVTEQNVRAGEQIGAGEAVEITVALKWREFTMPNLLYKSQTTAVQLLKNIGIDAEVEQEISELVASGLVMKQEIEADQSVEPEQKVVLTVSSGSKPFEMPEVIGKEEADAQEILLEKGLAIDIQYAYDKDTEVGCVISQSIEAGYDVTRGTEIHIFVCSDDELTEVADVSGQSADNAEKALKKQGFEVITSEAYSDSVEKGKVISQLPEAGSMQIPGSTISLTISKGTEPKAVETEKSNNSSPSSSPSGSSQAVWSDWSTSLPSDVSSSNAYIEQRTQYRFRTRETMESSEASASGWALYNTISSWGEYGSWSDWSTGAVSGSDSRQVESKTQYRYRDLQTTTSNSSYLDGWTQTGSSTSWSDYGGWSDWQDGAVSASDSRQVETRTVWGYYYYVCPGCGARMHGWNMTCPTWAGGCGVTYIPETANHEVWSTISWDSAGLSEWHGTGKYVTTAIDGGYCFKWTDAGSKTQYRYRDRSQITTYTYQKWGSWSSWSDSSYSGSSTRQVQAQTVYRSRERQLNYLYYYERWSNWSEYGDTLVSSGGNVEVQSRVLYRYKKK